MDIRNSALGFAFGVVVAHWLPWAHTLWIGWSCAGAGLLLARRARILGAAAIGLGWGSFHAVDALDRRLDPSCEQATVTGRVVDLPSTSEPVSPGAPRAQRFVLSPDAASCDIGGRIRLTWFDGPTLRGGERWRLHVRLKRPRGTANAHGFDAGKWFVRHRFAATGYVLSGSHLPDADAGLFTGVSAPLDVRERVRDGLGRLPLVNPGVIAALTIGDASAIPRRDLDLYRRTGTMHLLVISGLHVGIVTTAGFLLGRTAGLLARRSPRIAGMATALSFAAAYVFLAGAGLSLLRAFAMSVAGLIAFTSGRSAAPSAVFAYALAVVLAIDPMAPLGVGFWLSFGAVAVLLGFFAPRRRPRSWIGSAVTAQLAIAVVFVPATTGITGLIHPLGFAVNLVAIPTVTLLVVPSALIGVAALGTPLGPWLLIASDFCISVVGEVLAFADHAAPFHIAAPGGWLPWLLASSAACLLPLSRLAVLGVVSATLVLLFASRATIPSGHMSLNVLDVGQGTAVLVRTAAHSLVYDTGPSFLSGGDSGVGVVLPALRGRGLDGVDRLVLSHADLDHVGGARSLLDGSRVGTILVGEPVPEVVAEPCLTGRQWLWDGVAFSVLGPPPGHGYSGNNASCVLLIETATTRVLLAGDIEELVEDTLAPPAVDVLLVPHHGSATSSSDRFVVATGPRFAIIGNGFANRFGHPSPRVVERYRRVGAHVLTTANAGALEWTSTRPEAISAERCRKSRYWRRDPVARYSASPTCALRRVRPSIELGASGRTLDVMAAND